MWLNPHHLSSSIWIRFHNKHLWIFEPVPRAAEIRKTAPPKRKLRKRFLWTNEICGSFDEKHWFWNPQASGFRLQHVLKKCPGNKLWKNEFPIPLPEKLSIWGSHDLPQSLKIRFRAPGVRPAAPMVPQGALEVPKWLPTVHIHELKGADGRERSP